MQTRTIESNQRVNEENRTGKNNLFQNQRKKRQDTDQKECTAKDKKHFFEIRSR